MEFFKSVEQAPEDPIFHIPVECKADPREYKVNLGVGAYRNSEGAPHVLNCVRRAENRIAERRLLMEYLPMEGDQIMVKEVLGLAFGSNYASTYGERLLGVQTIGGSGALSLIGQLLKEEHDQTIYLSDPTWANHSPIFRRAGVTTHSYTYLNWNTLRLDFQGLCDSLQKLPKGSAVLLHACCHNPSGINPSEGEWRQLSELMKQCELLPVFDCAYQGFGKSLERDCFSLNLFAEEGHEILVALSCSKNFSLYGQRAGVLALLTQDPEKSKRVYSQVKRYVRGLYSNPPKHPADIVKTVLRDLRNEWVEELNHMRERIQEMRKALHSMLLSRCSDTDLSFYSLQEGMFSFTGLTKEQVLELRKEKAVYMAPDGRINVAGLNWSNLEHVADSLAGAYNSGSHSLKS